MLFFCHRGQEMVNSSLNLIVPVVLDDGILSAASDSKVPVVKDGKGSGSCWGKFPALPTQQ